MTKGYPSLNQDQKQEVISRIKDKGERVPDLAKEFGVTTRSIYGYLARSGQGSNSLLEISKLKREKEALVRIIGQLTVDQRLGKKIQHHYGSQQRIST
jgi:transposase-like protein